MPALDTVGKIIDYARVLLQDTIGAAVDPDPETYRYPTAQLIEILNMGVADARRLRPDLFLSVSPAAMQIPFYTSLTDVITIDPQYRMAFVYYVVGQAHLRDEEDTQDVRSAALMSQYSSMLLQPIMQVATRRA